MKFLITISLILLIKFSIEQTTNRRRTSSSSSTNRRIRSDISTIKGLQTASDDGMGKYLTSTDGYSLYVNIDAGQSVINCYDECSRKWPPAMIKKKQKVILGEDVKTVYFYVEDTQPGSKKGHGLEGYYLISAKGKPLVADANGRYNSDEGNRNITNLNNDDNSSPYSSSTTTMRSKSLLTNGLATLILIPDILTIEFSISSSDENFEVAFDNCDEKSKKALSELAKSNLLLQNSIILVDKIVNTKSIIFSCTNIFRTTLKEDETEKLSKIANVLNQQKSTYKITYNFSNEIISGAKSFLYSSAVSNSFENAYNIIDPLSLKIDKINPIRSITVISNNVEEFTPVLDQNTSTYFPRFKKVESRTVTVKVSVDYNII
jgi:hypothetical protein